MSNDVKHCYYSAPVAVQSIVINPSVCLSVRKNISLEPLDQLAQNFVCGSPVAVTRSSCGSVAICYVLPVLWMMSRLSVVGRMALHGRPEQLLAVSYVHDRGRV